MINGKAVKLARESRYFSQKDFCEKADIPQSKLSKIENGLLDADEDTVTKLSCMLGYPREFFYQDMEIYPPNLHYRKRSAVTSKMLSAVEAQMNIYRERIQRLLPSGVLEQNINPFSKYGTHSPTEGAAYLRQFWNVPRGPIKNLVKLIEDNGIIVIQMDFMTDKIDGRSIKTSKNQNIIFLNLRLPMDRRRYTLAHELAHILLHLYTQVPGDIDIEKEANEFASAFLMPPDEIKPYLLSSTSIPQLIELKRFWKVSVYSLIVAMDRYKILPSPKIKSLYVQYSSRGMRKGEPAALPEEEPTLLKEILDEHITKLNYTPRDLQTVMFTTPEEYIRLFRPTTLGVKLKIA